MNFYIGENNLIYYVIKIVNIWTSHIFFPECRGCKHINVHGHGPQQQPVDDHS